VKVSLCENGYSRFVIWIDAN